MQTTIRLQSLTFGNVRTYTAASLFILANLIVPQLFHLLPQGGATWLPIYFFTLIGAYIYGWRVGVLTALASPLLSSILFGMPTAAVLPAIMIKSLLLGILAGSMAYKFKKATIGIMAIVVMGYQIVGTMAEWGLSGNLWIACQDFRIGLPGMIMQIIGGWFVINTLTRK